jgi:hypothetical protein
VLADELLTRTGDVQLRKGDWYEFLGAIHESLADLPGRDRLDGKSGRSTRGESHLSVASRIRTKRGSAPGMKVKLIGSGEGSKQYVVIVSAGDEVY